jgi:ABC-type iron transport system FetAB ATPase subunit
MELFQCYDIPLSTNTEHYSGGEKLRISLVRAFHLGEVIVINTNLNSLDKGAKSKVLANIRKLVDGLFL